jgi:ATP-binding cassette, subfamily B, bacterial MsbA
VPAFEPPEKRCGRTDPELSKKKDDKKRADPSEVIAVIRRVLSENGREYIWSYVAAGAWLIAIAAATAFTAWIMRDVIDKIFYKQRSDLIVLISLAVFGAFTLRGVGSYAQAIILAKVGNNLVARYQQRLFDHLMRLGIDFHTSKRSGQLAAQLNYNVNGIRDLLNTTVTTVARDVVTLIALIAVMVNQDPVLSIFAFLIGPPLIYTVNRLVRRMRTMTRATVETNSRLIGAIQEATQGIAVVKAFTMEDQLSRRIGKLILDSEKRNNKIAVVSERLTPVSEILAGFAVASVIAYAGYRAAYSQQPPGAVFSFISALLLAYDPARRLARVQVSLEKSLVNARMIYEILDLQPRQRDTADARPVAVSRGEVRFENVSFGYSEEFPVLDGVSFVAEAGKLTAIVGASGAGKSTLTALLERFYDVEGGTITIDGQDISKVTKQSLRHVIAFVSQQPYMFEGSIGDNIRYGREDATDDEIRHAAELAAADEFIREQPQGYDTPVGENGVTLSGGQRQRVSIARAIVRNAPILLLDEATSALDTESEARVQDAVATVMKGRTVIVIAHRLSTVVNADKIVVLESGCVVEEGKHDALLAIPNGVYSRFYRVQSKKGLGLVDDTKPLPGKRIGKLASRAVL